MNEEIRVRSGFGDLPINDRETKRSVATALFKQVVSKPSSISRQYDKNFIIQVEDVTEIVLKLEQFFSRHNCAESQFNFELSLDSGDTVSENSLEKLLNLDSSHSSRVTELTINAHFLIAPDIADQPARYEIDITLRSFELPSLLNSMKLPLSFSIPRMSMSIEFKDYIIAQSLKAIIDDWAKGLDEFTKDNTFDFYRRICQFSAGNSTQISTILALISVLAFQEITEDLTRHQILIFSILSIILISITSISIKFTCQKIMTKISDLSEISVINFTKGDKNYINKAKNNNTQAKSSSIKYLIGLIFEFILAILAGLIVFYVTIG